MRTFAQRNTGAGRAGVRASASRTGWAGRGACSEVNESGEACALSEERRARVVSCFRAGLGQWWDKGECASGKFAVLRACRCGHERSHGEVQGDGGGARELTYRPGGDAGSR
jgi:hypothetical protein